MGLGGQGPPKKLKRLPDRDDDADADEDHVGILYALFTTVVYNQNLLFESLEKIKMNTSHTRKMALELVSNGSEFVYAEHKGTPTLGTIAFACAYCNTTPSRRIPSLFEAIHGFRKYPVLQLAH